MLTFFLGSRGFEMRGSRRERIKERERERSRESQIK